MGTLRLLRSTDLAHDCSAALRSFVCYCESRNLSPETTAWYSRRVGRFLSFATQRELTPGSTTRQHLREFLAGLPPTVTPPTRNGYRRAVRAFFGYLVREGELPDNPAAGVEKAREIRRQPAVLSAEQLRSLLRQPIRARFTGARDHALLCLLADTGCRISEALGIRLGDVNWPQSVVTVLGKGGKERLLPLGNQVRLALRRYLDKRGEACEQDLLFVTRTGSRVTARHAHRSMQRYARAAGIEGRGSPHTLRYSFAVSWLRAGGDVITLQRVLGHSSLQMVNHYAVLAAADVQAAHRRWSPVDRLAGHQTAPYAQMNLYRAGGWHRGEGNRQRAV